MNIFVKLSSTRYLLPLAAGAAVAITGCTAPVAGQPPSRKAATMSTARLTSGAGIAGPFAVVLHHENGSTPASVVSMRSRRVIGQVSVPVTHSSFPWVAAATDDRTFVLADETPSLKFRFYLLKLSAVGHPGALTALRVPAPHGAQIYGMALSASAGRLALAWLNGPTFPPVSQIQVTSLRTGATRTWSGPAGSAAADVSWAASRFVVFEWQSSVRLAQSGIRVLDTEGPGASVLASRLLIPVTTRFAGLHSPGMPVVTPDGSAIFAVMGDRQGNDVLVEFSGRTGVPVRRVIPVGPARHSTQFLVCGVLVTDSTGQHLVVQCGTAQARIDDGVISPVRLAMLVPLSPVPWASDLAW